MPLASIANAPATTAKSEPVAYRRGRGDTTVINHMRHGRWVEVSETQGRRIVKLATAGGRSIHTRGGRYIGKTYVRFYGFAGKMLNATGKKRGGRAMVLRYASRGDYRGSNRAEVAADVMKDVRRAVEDAERRHVRDQVSYLLAARTITTEQGDRLFKALGYPRLMSSHIAATNSVQTPSIPKLGDMPETMVSYYGDRRGRLSFVIALPTGNRRYSIVPLWDKRAPAATKKRGGKHIFIGYKAESTMGNTLYNLTTTGMHGWMGSFSLFQSAGQARRAIVANVKRLVGGIELRESKTQYTARLAAEQPAGQLARRGGRSAQAAPQSAVTRLRLLVKQMRNLNGSGIGVMHRAAPSGKSSEAMILLHRNTRIWPKEEREAFATVAEMLRRGGFGAKIDYVNRRIIVSGVEDKEAAPRTQKKVSRMTVADMQETNRQRAGLSRAEDPAKSATSLGWHLGWEDSARGKPAEAVLATQRFPKGWQAAGIHGYKEGYAAEGSQS